MTKPSLLPLFTASILFSYTGLISAEEIRSTLDDQKAVAVTIYNQNLALIKDQRTVTLNKGLNKLAFRGVSAKMRPETALLRSLNPAIQLQVIEQNFDFDLLTPQKMLEKYVGKQVELTQINPATGQANTQTATVLSTNSGVVLKIGDKIVTNPQGQYSFSNVPANLRDQPTLVTQLQSSSAKQQQVELGYLTSGLSWKADYVAELNQDDTQLDLTGWVTLTNQSGTSYHNAKLQLVAGDVNQVNSRDQYVAAPQLEMANMRTKASVDMVEESLFEYHLYSLGRNTDLADKQTKQVALLSASSMPVTKELVLQGNQFYYSRGYGEIGRDKKVGVFVKFDNTEQSQLGMPIPKGVVRVYKNDSQGNAQFVGEDHIDHTAKNDDITLKLGDAFDVTANIKQTQFRKVSHKSHNHAAYQSAFEIEINNAKSEPVTVTVREPIPGDWKMLNESHPHTKISSGMAEWQVTIAAESKQQLTYKVHVEY